MKLKIELLQEPRDFPKIALVSAVAGFVTWFVFVIGFPFLKAILNSLPVRDVLTASLQTNTVFGLFLALLIFFSIFLGFTFPRAPVRVTIQFSDKKDFVTRLIMATSQLGYVTASVMDDSMRFRPIIQIGDLGTISVQLEHDHAVMSGPKMHVKKIVKRLETC